MDLSWLLCFFFFFQAEDGIRDVAVTGVQTCALPIWSLRVQSGQSVSSPFSADRFFYFSSLLVTANPAHNLVLNPERQRRRETRLPWLARRSSRARRSRPNSTAAETFAAKNPCSKR